MTDNREFRSGLRACRRGLWVAGVFSLALNLLMLTVPLYMMQVYDRVLSSRSEETLVMLSILAVGALAVVALLEVVRQIVLTRSGARLETALGGRMLASSLDAAQRAGPEIQGLRDLGQVRQFISSPLMSAMFDAPVVPVYIALLFLIHPHLGWLSLGAAVVLVLVSVLNQQVTKTPLGEAAGHGLAALQTAQAQVRNAEVIRAMGMFSACVGSWGEENARGMIAADRAARRNALLSGLTKFLRLLLQIAILGYGAWLVLQDASVSAGIIFAASIIAARALAPIDQAVGGWRNFTGALQSWRWIKQLLAATPAAPELMDLPAPHAGIAVERLFYSPGKGVEPIIKGISFAVEPGEIIGVIGPSGAGKSTLARLLVGALQPSAGEVRIGGDDLRHWSPEALGPYIGYLPQDIELFPATVAENIARMNPAPDAQKVVEAARLANCHELIQRLPKGYDTPLGPQGHALSGGQRQRIALARAFYGRPRLVVLDEPNASLDGDGEQALIAALIKANAAGITCIVITQRTSIVPALTKVMVLRDGRIEAFGPREQILAQQIRTATSEGRSVAPEAVAGSGQQAATADRRQGQEPAAPVQHSPGAAATPVTITARLA